MSFLTPNDEGAFEDFPLKEKPTYDFQKDYVVCPKCFGHGGWNLTLNAYNISGMPNTPENRHKHSHFRAFCEQCKGWGWTSPENAKCLHEMQHYKNTGNCLNEYKCSKCGKIEEVDSSG